MKICEKSFWFNLMETDHNLCLNLLFFCFDQSLTFAVQENKVESPLKWYKRLICPDSDSHKKALQSTFVIWFDHAYVNEQKFVLQIGLSQASNTW